MSGARANLLVEIGTEELPPRALQSLARAFADELARALAEEGMLGESGGAAALTWFATPRRLAVRIKHVAAAQPRRVMERRGPSLRAAYDAAGKPTRAALGFAKSCGVSMAKLQRVETEKGAWLVCRESRAGKKLAEVLSDCLAQALRRLPAPKRMRWGGGEVEFVRPAHWLLALHGARVVKAEALGLRAGRHTRG
ncbi:MAG: glycine--tRNA ligase subunit beta, partial [Gammaproteobacteria bacterium]|nr:glycine--tRNA ligase subunit beta [Gammaproteobacteria bacterium]